MDYIKGNKQAWEEAFEHRHEGWCGDMLRRLQSEELPYMNEMLKTALRSLKLKNKAIAQFCCNNGRELLSAMQLGAKAGYGFDIAENMIAQANEVAKQAKLNCTFTARNILEIGDEYNETFDLVLFTIGAITWFEDLEALFSAAARCLKPGGVLLLNDFHPFVCMLPLPDEDAFDPNATNRVVYSYFRKDPWLEQNSGGYMTHHQNSHTFTSFSHTMGSIVNAAVAAGLQIQALQEFDTDIGMTDVYNGKGFPLSFTLTAKKAG